MPLRIPPSDLDTFNSLVSLSEDKYQALAEALRRGEPEMTSAGLARRVASETGLDVSEIRPIISAIGSLFLTREQQGISSDKFLTEVLEALKHDKLVDEQDQAKQETLRGRISELLSFDQSLGVSVKAARLITRHKNVFLSATILSDIRPIFSGDETPVPRGAVLIHMLGIEAYTDGQRNTNYFALDSSDLLRLKKAIDRAVRKENAIRETLKTMPLLTVRETEG